MSSQAGGEPSSPLDGTPATKLNVTIGIAAFIVIFGCVVFFITLDLCLRYFVGQQIVPTGRSRRRGLMGTDGYTNLLNRGLDKAVVDALPVFVYAKEEGRGGIECVVCLSDFEDKEQGRILPKCSHAFHTACIDMWFQSHATCPVCRSTVNAPSTEEDQPPIAASDEHSSNSSSSAEQQAGPSSESEAAESSPHLAIDIPNAASLKASTDQEFRSPVLERLKSLRRLLSSSSRTSEQQ